MSSLIHRSLTGRLLLAVACIVALGATAMAGLSGRIQIDGSSTVYPITEAVAEDFQKANAGVQATIGIAGTGGGFKRFCAGETDISDASRPITPSEVDTCSKNGMQFIELPIAFDGLCVVVNKKDTWVDYLTTAELRKIWDAGSTLSNWKDVRAGFPDVPLKLYGPTSNNGTFDYFTEAINGKAKQSRTDYSSSVTPEVLAQGVASAKGGLGYFGMAYYQENKDKLKLVPIGEKKVLPSQETVRNGTYLPLSRPLFIYISTKAALRPEVAAFVDYYLNNAGRLSKSVGYVPLPDSAYKTVNTHWQARKTGAHFGSAKPGMTIEQVMSKEN